MTYESVEISVHDGEIVELYQFTHGSSLYYQTSGNTDYVYLGDTYGSESLDRDAFERTGEINRSAISIYCSADNPVAELFRNGAPERQVSVNILQGHYTDGDFVSIFPGRVTDCKWNKTGQATLFCEPLITSLKRTALRCNYNPSCPYIVYSTQCRATRSYVAGTVTAVNGVNVSVYTASTIPAGRLLGGTIRAGNYSRTIVGQSGDDLELISAIDVSVGDSVDLSIGCNKSTKACDEWHDNINNFGGEPYIPNKNPFSGYMS
jgi:hypothetical protein